MMTYANLTTQVVKEAEKLCAYLQLPRCAEMTTRYVSAVDDLLRAREKWKSNVKGSIVTQHMKKYYELFDDEQRSLIETYIKRSVYDELIADVEQGYRNAATVPKS